jgi:hypothetical protein
MKKSKLCQVLQRNNEKSAKEIDQIGRFFAHWEIAYFGQLLKITEVAQIFELLFPRLKLCDTFDKNGFGYILGDFFTISSDHPDAKMH